MGLSAAECRDLAGLAAEQGLFLMEALWTLFLPKFDVIRQLLEADALGTVHSVMLLRPRRISAGETESPLRPLADTITTMLVIDAVREATSR